MEESEGRSDVMAAGWRRDPVDSTRWRWWDGRQWTRIVGSDGAKTTDWRDVPGPVGPGAAPDLPPRPRGFFDIRGDLIYKAGRSVWAATVRAARRPAPIQGEHRTFARRWVPRFIRQWASVTTDDVGITIRDGRTTERLRWGDIDHFVVECAVNDSIDGELGGTHVSKRFAVSLRSGGTFVASPLIPWRFVPILDRRLAVERNQDWQGPPTDVLHHMMIW